MPMQTGRNFLAATATLAVFAGLGFAANHRELNHRELNGTWNLVPTRSVLNGEPAIETGSVTIDDREGNIYVSRTFSFDGANRSVTTSFGTDARHNASIKDKDRAFKSKAKWDGDVLKVNTIHEGITTVERYSLLGDGAMMLQVDRTGRPSETLYFQRQ
jgi:hypothetical protein